MVPLTGLEPVRSLERGILSPLRLPIPPQRLDFQKQSNDSATLFPKHFKSIAKRAANVNDFRPLTQKNHKLAQIGPLCLAAKSSLSRFT